MKAATGCEGVKSRARLHDQDPDPQWPHLIGCTLAAVFLR
jgi:hypothetical protein